MVKREDEKMKRILIVLAVCLMLLLAITATTAMAKPAKSTYDGKTAGNNGFANIVGSDVPDVSGWVKYSKASKELHTTWVINGLEPNTDYQLKVTSTTGDERIGDACDEQGDPWQCGYWGGTSFLVIATVQTNENGHIGQAVKTSLESGDYSDIQFIVTLNEPPWSSAWTWENGPDWQNPTNSQFTIK